MVGRVAHFVLVLVLAQIATAFIFNDTLLEDEIKLNGIKTRRKERSTSSEGGSVGKKAEQLSESLNVMFTDSSSADSAGQKKKTKRKKKKDRTPKSTVERKGWRKWHRKCTRCPEDMRMKWRNPSISWICGAYQQARRSFKSPCMMYYRNCQDGTMFTKIADHRCANGTRDGIRPYNFHFFYDYNVVLTSEESESASQSVSKSDPESTEVDETELEKNLPKFYFNGPN